MCRNIKKKLNFEVEVSRIENINIDNVLLQDLSILYSYEDLKRELHSRPIDFLKLHEFQMEIGKLGEAFVYEYECKKLIGTKYINMIDEKKALDYKNGYDILSYTREGDPLHIEVKCTVGTDHIFYLSNNELKTAKRMKAEGLTYVVYFVQGIMSNSPSITKIEDVSNNNEYVFEEMNWKVSKKSHY